MLSVVLVPVFKDKAGKISSKDNYCPIPLASMFSKLIEIIILDRIEITWILILTSLVLRRNMELIRVCVLKEVIDLYRSLNGSEFCMFS